MSRRRTGNRRGRPTTSNDFHLIVVPRTTTDLRKLGGALVALSLHRARTHDDQDDATKEQNDGSA